MGEIDPKKIVKYLLVMGFFGIIYLIEALTTGENEKYSFFGAMSAIIFWFMLIIFVAMMIALPFYQKNQNQIRDFANELADYIKSNHLHGEDKNSFFDTTNGDEPIGVCPLYDDFGNEYLLMYNARIKQRILIKKGSVTGYHLNVDGRQYRAVGGSFFGMGFVKGNLQKIGRIEMVISLNNTSMPVVHYRIATDLTQGFFDEYQRFVDRLGALLALYM